MTPPRPDPEPDSGFQWRTLRRLVPYLWPKDNFGLRVRVVIAVLCLVAAKLLTITIPFAFEAVINVLEAEPLVVVPVAILLAYGLARLMSQAFAQLRDAVFARVGLDALRRLALEVFTYLHRIALRFHLERRTGGLSRTIERGVQGIDFMLRFMLFNIVPTIIELTLVVAIMTGKFDIWFGLATGLTVLAYVVFTFAVTEWRVKFRREMNKQDNEANSRAIDSLLNYETVKYFGNEAHEADRYRRALLRYGEASVTSQNTLAGLNVGQTAIITIGLVVMMVMAADRLVAGEMDLGGFVFVNTILIQVFQPLGFLGFVYREMKRSLVDMEKMFELLDVPLEIDDVPDAAPISVTEGALEFRDVHFSYEADRQILGGLSFRVEPGQTLAIVGPSGAGKSTISRLIFRFYDPTSGQILIDGQDIAKVQQDSLRHAVGMVPQDTVLFNDSIGYNIRYGRPGATHEEVEAAAKMAAVYDFVSGLPQGFDTTVGERGLKLSGGEKQRVAIARTLLKNPPLLVLDEATSALDSRTEQDIQTALRQISRNRTTVVIAHRLSTIIDADHILVLEKGRIAEQGTHAELIARPNGLYAEMWSRQQEAVQMSEKLAQLQEERG